MLTAVRQVGEILGKGIGRRTTSPVVYADPRLMAGIARNIPVFPFDHMQALCMRGGITRPSTDPRFRHRNVSVPMCVHGPGCAANHPRYSLRPVELRPDEPFVIMPWMTPAELATFEATGVAPAGHERRSCVLCTGMWTEYVQITVRAIAHGMPTNIVLSSSYQNQFGVPGEFRDTEMLHGGGPNWNGLVAPTMAFRPALMRTVCIADEGFVDVYMVDISAMRTPEPLPNFQQGGAAGAQGQ